MRPERREYTKVQYYWTCAVPQHRHQTEGVATDCLEKWPERPRQKVRVWTEEKLAEVKARHDGGETYTSIGRSMNITGGRVSQRMRGYEWTLRRRAERRAAGFP